MIKFNHIEKPFLIKRLGITKGAFTKKVSPKYSQTFSPREKSIIAEAFLEVAVKLKGEADRIINETKSGNDH